MSDGTAAGRALNRAAVAGYDRSAEDYAAVTDHAPFPEQSTALAQFAVLLGDGARVLEIASGPGWDADRLEALGATVERTDAADGFVDFQRGRGKSARRLDLLDDDLGGPWDGVMALYVIQHVPRALVGSVLERITAALRPGGVLLMSWQIGEGERVSVEDNGRYPIVQWSRDGMIGALEAAGLATAWEAECEGSDAHWGLAIARRP